MRKVRYIIVLNQIFLPFPYNIPVEYCSSNNIDNVMRCQLLIMLFQFVFILGSLKSSHIFLIYLYCNAVSNNLFLFFRKPENELKRDL